MVKPTRSSSGRNGAAANPNMAGVLMVGLGCETFQIGRWKQAYGIAESETFLSFTIQDAGGTRAAVVSGLAAIRDMLAIVNAARREPCPAAELILALQCGGSDGYSGITSSTTREWAGPACRCQRYRVGARDDCDATSIVWRSSHRRRE
nr:UxaA family hydrolase [Bradyrhizobium sp. 150]